MLSDDRSWEDLASHSPRHFKGEPVRPVIDEGNRKGIRRCFCPAAPPSSSQCSSESRSSRCGLQESASERMSCISWSPFGFPGTDRDSWEHLAQQVRIPCCFV